MPSARTDRRPGERSAQCSGKPDAGGGPRRHTNIHGVKVVYRVGEQEQTPLEGFESSGAETVLAYRSNTTIRDQNHHGCIADRLRLRSAQSLVEANSKGDRNPTSVRLQNPS